MITEAPEDEGTAVEHALLSFYRLLEKFDLLRR